MPEDTSKERKAGIGTVKFFDRKNKRGLIKPRWASEEEKVADNLYFEVSDVEAYRFRVGQLVQFVVTQDGDLDQQAKDVNVLSDKA